MSTRKYRNPELNSSWYLSIEQGKKAACSQRSEWSRRLAGHSVRAQQWGTGRKAEAGVRLYPPLVKWEAKRWGDPVVAMC